MDRTQEVSAISPTKDNRIKNSLPFSSFQTHHKIVLTNSCFTSSYRYLYQVVTS